jgi:hypothetical protein
MDVLASNPYMAVMKLLVVFLLLIAQVHASDITDAFKKKDFRKVSDIYRDNQKRVYTSKELIYISFSLRQLRFFRQDIKLNVRLIKANFEADHKKILVKLKNSDTVDGDEVPKALKVLYWNLLNDYGEIIKGYDSLSKRLDKDQVHYNTFSKILGEIEFRESKVDKKNEEIIGHIQFVTNKVYKRTSSFFISYVSWQQDAEIRKNDGSHAGLILTNKGFCPGGETGWENYLWHFSIDGCFMFGSGGVSKQGTSTIRKYQQSNIPAIGFKASPGISMIVSSTRSRIGIKIPIIYTMQKLTPPSSAYTMKQDSPLSIVTSLYSRWQFPNWYFQTEFGKYVSKESTFWGFGIGKSF